jgi:alpha-D-ribose 1-methylphosphonate 5-triphosphate synthase subunit PhnG
VKSVTSPSHVFGNRPVMVAQEAPKDSVSSTARLAVMAALAKAEPAELEGPVERLWPRLDIRDLRAPEIGLVMLRGRIGGDGAAFNLGEATVTRAVVELPGGYRGYGQRLGRQPLAARLAAIVDALWQDDTERARVESEIVTPIRRRLAVEASRTKAETAATKVDFFTLVRGDPDA